MRKRPLAMVCLVMILMLFLSTKIVKDSPPAFLAWTGNQVTVTGEVYQKEVYLKAEKEVAVVYIKISSVVSGPVRAQVEEGDYRAICYLSSNQDMPEMGSTIQATGILKCFDKATNPGQFDAESYYQVLNISFQLNQTEIQQKSFTYHRGKEALYWLKCRLSSTIDRILPQKDASVMKTMLLGEKKAVDTERKALYQKNGIAHILAISALHISLIGMTLFNGLRKIGLPIWICSALSVMLICLYGSMVGSSVSVIRAVGMFAIHLLGRSFRRTYDMTTAIAVMAFFILAEQPLYLFNSSFLLSFGCVLAIALLIPALTKKRLKKEKEPPQWFGKFVGGFVITAAMLPFQMQFFYQTPVYAVFLNLLVIPMMSLLLPAGVLLLGVEEIRGILSDAEYGFTLSSMRCGLIANCDSEFWLTRLLAYLISGILAIYDGACEVCSKFPGALLWTGQPPLWKTICFFMVLLLIVLWQKKVSLKKKWIAFIMAVVLLLSPVEDVFRRMIGAFGQSQGECRVSFLDVGQGDCIHIESGGGKHYLVDGGSSNVSSVGKYRILPYLKYCGAGEIEAIFVTHPDEDHCNGILELLELTDEEGIMIKRLCLPDVSVFSRTDAYWELIRAADNAGVPVVYFSKGMSLQDGEMSLQCLHPVAGYAAENENEYSLVLLVRCDEFEALLTGDVEKEGEEMLIQTLRELNGEMADGGQAKTNITGSGIGVEPTENTFMEVDVLKVAHHGSRYSTSEEFLSLIRPEVAVISCGRNNFYGHPHEETLERLADVGSEVYSTAEGGAITVTIGKKLEVGLYKKQADE